MNYKTQVERMVSPGLFDLREEFVKRGFDLRLVGGCVRDLVRQVECYDIDLCTDATPDEQRAIYEHMKATYGYGFDYIPTGEQHGTFTVIPVRGCDGYEITSLRTESEHDGRYAKMAFTRDWVEDLSRRDLTINAMALTFDGELIDPFNGAEDLHAKVIRFVGDPKERMTEDYLRILRYFRFMGRIVPYNFRTDDEIDSTIPVEAIHECLPGLRKISVERIWAEVSKMLNDKDSRWVYALMAKLGVMEHTPLPVPNDWHLHRFHHLKRQKHDLLTPVVLMCSFFDSAEQADQVARALKWSTEEREMAKHIMSYSSAVTGEDIHYQVIVKGVKRHYAAAAAVFHGVAEMKDVHTKPIPAFPVTGIDLLNAGIKPGPRMGAIMHELKERWFYSGCRPSATELLEHVTA